MAMRKGTAGHGLIVGACSLSLAGMAVAMVSGVAGEATAPFEWRLPPGVAAPPVPADNPMTVEKVELGRYLFYDVRLSGNQTQSCGSCHRQALAFTDGRARAVGSTGVTHPRSSMSLVNVGYADALTWSDPTMRRLEDQALVPMFGTDPVEMGLEAPGSITLARLRATKPYPRLFEQAFPGAVEGVTLQHVTQALASFERSLVSARSPYDRWHFNGEIHAITASAKRGEALFFSRTLRCFRCHSGFTFAETTEPDAGLRTGFHNTGLYNVAGLLSYPSPNAGVFEKTKNPRDVGRFKAPTLRNIAVTAPYMHDGSLATLDAVLDHYAAGGRTIDSGPAKGVGRDNPNKSPIVSGFTLSADQRSDLLTFLQSLTDAEMLRDERFSDPWVRTSGQPVAK